MSSLALVITFARITSTDGGATAAVPCKDEGEVPAWSDGGGSTATVVDHNIMSRLPKSAPPRHLHIHWPLPRNVLLFYAPSFFPVIIFPYSCC